MASLIEYGSIGHGIGLRTVHYQAFRDNRPPEGIDWVEVISENFLDVGGRPAEILKHVSRRIPVVLHGVSMNIGGVDPLDDSYLDALRMLADKHDAPWLSDHLCRSIAAPSAASAAWRRSSNGMPRFPASTGSSTNRAAHDKSSSRSCPMPSLRELQRAMKRAIHDREAHDFAAFVADGDAEARANIYVDMYWSRLISSLEQDFPTVAAMLGETLFPRVAATHIEARPSSRQNLGFLGEAFEGTLQELGRPREAAVARLEWARNAAFWSEDARAVTADEVAAWGDAFGEARLGLHPSLHLTLLALGARQRVEGGTDDVDTAQSEWVAVWRQESGQVRQLAIDAMEAEALEAAGGGATVAAVFERFAAADDPETAALRAILGWLERGWIAALTSPN